MSTLSLRKIKHDSSAVDNITLNSNGSTAVNSLSVINSASPTSWVSVDAGLTTQSMYLQANTTSGDVRVGSYTNHPFGLYTNNVERLRIDTSGYITMPYQPAFSVTRSAGDIASDSIYVGNVVMLNNGSHYNTSNGRFTAPVTGIYAFHCYFMASGSTNDTAISGQFWKNGAGLGNSVPYTRANGENFQGMAGHVIIPLNANDYVQLKNSGSSGWYGTGTGHNAFSGHLIG